MLEAFELFVAARYLKAKRRQTVISLITVISVVGVAAGVMALVIALAVNNGFRSSLETNLLGATPHVTILEKEPSSGIADWRATLLRVVSFRSAPNCASCPASLRLNRRCTARSSPPGRSNRPRPRSRACPSTPPS